MKTNKLFLMSITLISSVSLSNLAMAEAETRTKITNAINECVKNENEKTKLNNLASKATEDTLKNILKAVQEGEAQDAANETKLAEKKEAFVQLIINAQEDKDASKAEEVVKAFFAVKNCLITTLK
jgi:hypothetical protein